MGKRRKKGDGLEDGKIKPKKKKKNPPLPLCFPLPPTLGFVFESGKLSYENLSPACQTFTILSTKVLWKAPQIK